jgi:hypothetical protein
VARLVKTALCLKINKNLTVKKFPPTMTGKDKGFMKVNWK